MLNLREEDIFINRTEKNLEEALKSLKEILRKNEFLIESYEKKQPSMIYIGNNTVIFNLTDPTTKTFNKTGLFLFHFPKGMTVERNKDKIYFLIGFLGSHEEYLNTIKKISLMIERKENQNTIKKLSSVESIQDFFKEKIHEAWSFMPHDIRENSLSKDINSLKINALARISEIDYLSNEHILEILKKDPVPLGEGFWLFENTLPISSIFNIIILKESFIYNNEDVRIFITINNFEKKSLFLELERLLANKILLKESSLWNKDMWCQYFNIINKE